MPSVNKNFHFIFLTILLSSSILAAQSNCKVKIDKDSIKVSTCHTDTSKFKSILAEFIVHGTLQRLQDFMLDFQGYKNWQFNTIESRSLVKLSDSEFIYYSQIEAPWPVADRDMVVRFTVERITPNQLIITANSVKGKMPEQKGFVRVPTSHSQWIITKISEDKLLVKYQMQIDPGGSVPVWLANWVCAQGPYQSFKKLKEQLERRK